MAELSQFLTKDSLAVYTPIAWSDLDSSPFQQMLWSTHGMTVPTGSPYEETYQPNNWFRQPATIVQTNGANGIRAYTGNVNPGTNNWHTVTNVTGAGWLTLAGVSCGVVGASGNNLRVTVDGVTRSASATDALWGGCLINTVPMTYPKPKDVNFGPSMSDYQKNAARGLITLGGIRFESNMKVEVMSSIGITSLRGHADYILEGEL